RAEDRLELALIENVQRENLTPLEEAEAYRHLIDERGLTQDELAERVGKSRPAITNTLRLLGLPDAVKAQLESGELTAGHGRAAEPSGETPGRGPSRRRPPPAWARRGAHAGSRHARADRASPAGRRDRDRVLLRRRARPPDRPPPAGRAARLTALTLAGSRC